MQLTRQHQDEFDQQGFTRLGQVFTPAEMDGALQALNKLHVEQPKFVASLTEPAVMFLLHDERLERIAQHLLRTDGVVHSSNTSLFKGLDDPGAGWKMGGEHVDIMYSQDELDASPRRMMCMLMILVGDLPEGRANTFVRPGSHRMIADHLAAQGQSPIKAKPTLLKDLPPLDWPEPQAIAGQCGEVIAFTTALIHSGSTNVTDQPRQLMFSNFCARGLMKQVAGNHDRWPDREKYRASLRDLFPADRHHLLADSFFD